MFDFAKTALSVVFFVCTGATSWSCLTPPPTVEEVRPTLHFPFELSSAITAEEREGFLEEVLELVHGSRECTNDMNSYIKLYQEQTLNQLSLLVSGLARLSANNDAYRSIVVKIKTDIDRVWTLTQDFKIYRVNGTEEDSHRNLATLYKTLDAFARSTEGQDAPLQRNQSLKAMKNIEQYLIGLQVRTFQRR